MLELELKAAIPNLEAVVARLEELGAQRTFVGHLEDRRLDDGDGSLRARDEMLRVRAYRVDDRVLSASLDWKGPARYPNGYKEREEVTVAAGDPAVLLDILGRVGFRPALAIDRMVWQYELGGVMVRLERYPCMDDLVEIEGAAEAMEAVIVCLGLDRATFGGDSIFDFARRFEARTGRRAVLARSEGHDG